MPPRARDRPPATPFPSPLADAMLPPNHPERPMAIPTPVNGQITDAATDTDTPSPGDTPARALGHLCQSLANAMSLAAENATIIQQQDHTTAQAAVTLAVNRLLQTPEAP